MGNNSSSSSKEFIKAQQKIYRNVFPQQIQILTVSIAKGFFKKSSQPQYQYYLGIDQHQKTYGIVGDIQNGQVKIYKLSQFNRTRQLVFQGEMLGRVREGFGVQYVKKQQNKNNFFSKMLLAQFQTFSKPKETKEIQDKEKKQSKKQQIQEVEVEQFYCGNFKNNLYNGWGLTSNYQGQWRLGQKNGFGKMFQLKDNNSSPRIIYVGQWQKDLPNGAGSSNVLVSDIQKFMTDEGIIKKSGLYGQYVGSWRNGIKTGYGKSVKYSKHDRTKEIYQGSFQNNLYHGQGTLTQKSVNSNTSLRVSKGFFRQGIFVQACNKKGKHSHKNKQKCLI